MMPQDRRQSVRKTPKHLGYLSLPFNNGGFVLDVSEGGLGFQAVAPIKATGPIRFRFAIDSPQRITAVGELAWIDESGRAGGLRFTELPEGVREQIRDWIGQSNVSAADVPVAEPANVLETVAGVQSDVMPASVEAPAEQAGVEALAEQASVEALAEQASVEAPAERAIEEATTPSPHDEAAAVPLLDIPVSEPAVAVSERAIASEVARSQEAAASTNVVTATNPFAYSSRPPLYTESSNQLSMFSAGLNPEAAPFALANPQSAGIKRPIAAVGLTIALAFLLSIPIFAYMSTSRVGDMLFHWSQRLRGASPTQPLRPDSVPPASSGSDLSKLPQQ